MACPKCHADDINYYPGSDDGIQRIAEFSQCLACGWMGFGDYRHIHFCIECGERNESRKPGKCDDCRTGVREMAMRMDAENMGVM